MADSEELLDDIPLPAAGSSTHHIKPTFVQSIRAAAAGRLPWRAVYERWGVAFGAGIVILGGIIFGFAIPPSNADPPPFDWISNVIGWTYFFAWGLSFYPQVFLNWRRRSVVGLSFDFEVYNLIGFLCYSIFNCALYWNGDVRIAYAAQSGGKPPEVQLNDVMFALHAEVLTLITIWQLFIYDRGDQKVSLACWIVSALLVFACTLYAILVAAGVSGHLFTWLTWMYFLSYVKLAVSLFKYMPQVYLNWSRKSTVGWNIWNVLLDFTGGILSVGQLIMDSWVGDNWEGFTGDPVKFGLGSVSMVFDVIFMVQHYVLYRHTQEPDYTPVL